MKFLKTGKVSALKQLQRLTGAPAASGKTLSRRNSYAQIHRVRLTYGHRNPLNQIDYNESLESANWLILLNSFDSTESANCGAKRYADDKYEQHSGAPEHQHSLGSEVPTNNVESCEVNKSSLRGGVQRLCGSLRPAQNLQVTKSHSQNNPEVIGSVHSITGSNTVHRTNDPSPV